LNSYHPEDARLSPLVSVIVPAYNAERYLPECLASIDAQNVPFSVETIIVDDGSLDSTAALATRHPRSTLLSQANRGPAAARNAGVAAARGKFIAFLDADDIWPKGKLEPQIELLKRNPTAALVFGDCLQFDENGPRLETLFRASRLGALEWGDTEILPQAYHRLIEDNFITTGSVIVRRSAFLAIGGFDESLRLVEDLDLWLRISAKWPIAWCAQVCLLRRRHDANISRDPESMAKAYIDVLTKRLQEDLYLEPVDQPRTRELMARAYLHLAGLAFDLGKPATAAMHAGRALYTSPGAAFGWLIARRGAIPRRVHKSDKEYPR
jgi:glycosyltransferase involved in cell wall biosynthesis